MKLPLTDLLERALPSAVAHYLGGHPVNVDRLGEWKHHLQLLRSIRSRPHEWRQMQVIEFDELPTEQRWGVGPSIPGRVVNQLYLACGLASPAAAPDTCPECLGTGVYRGLHVVEVCRRCG